MSINVVREWVGGEPCDSDVLAILASYSGDPYKAALAILRRRLADFVSQPATWDIKDDYGQSTSENIRTLRQMISRLETIIGDDDTVAAGWQAVPIAGPNLSVR